MLVLDSLSFKIKIIKFLVWLMGFFIHFFYDKTDHELRQTVFLRNAMNL